MVEERAGEEWRLLVFKGKLLSLTPVNDQLGVEEGWMDGCG